MYVLISAQGDGADIRHGAALIAAEDVELAVDAGPAAAEGEVFIGYHGLCVFKVNNNSGQHLRYLLVGGGLAYEVLGIYGLLLLQTGLGEVDV